MRIVVTGSRAWSNDIAIYQTLYEAHKAHGPFTLVHGACSTGADAMAHHWYEVVGRLLNCEEVKFQADWGQFGKRAGPIRNKQMIEAGADLVLAFPLPRGSGTQHTIDLARAAGITVKEYGRE